MRTIYVVCCMSLSLMFTAIACQHDEPVNSADTDLVEREAPFAHASFHEALPDPGVFHNEVVVAYFAVRDRDHHRPLTAESFVNYMTSAANEVLAARGRAVPVRREDIGVLFAFFVDLRDAGIYNVFDVNESPSRLVAYLRSVGSIPGGAANAIQFFLHHSLDNGYADPDPVILADATLAIASDASVRTFLAVQRASAELSTTLPLPDRINPKGGVIAMTKQSAVAIVDAVAAISFAEFGPYATILAGTMASSLFREALEDDEPITWYDPCTPCF